MRANITMKVNKRLIDPVVMVTDVHPSIELNEENKEKQDKLCTYLENAFLTYMRYDAICSLQGYVEIFRRAESEEVIELIKNQGHIDIIVEGNFSPVDIFQRLFNRNSCFYPSTNKIVEHFRWDPLYQDLMLVGFTAKVFPDIMKEEENLGDHYIDAFDVKLEYVKGSE